LKKLSALFVGLDEVAPARNGLGLIGGIGH
jgi:hypothetical protein